MLHTWYGCPLFNCTEKVGTHHFARQTDWIFFRRVISFIVLKIVTVRGCAAEGEKRETDRQTETDRQRERDSFFCRGKSEIR